MFQANGANDASTTSTLWRCSSPSFCGGLVGGISHGPCGPHKEIVRTGPLHASIMKSQLHQHGPQLLLREDPCSSPVLHFVAQLHTDVAVVLLISGCLPAGLREPLLLCGNQLINQALRFEVIQPLPLGRMPPSLRRGLAQLVNQGHGFDGMRILWPCTSGRKGLGQKSMSHIDHHTASQHKHSQVKPPKTMSFQCPPLFHWLVASNQSKPFLTSLNFFMICLQQLQ